jgi:leucyl/phenylalanyl-tRNA--protein transferase
MAREPHSVDDLLVPADVIRQPMPADIGLSAPRFFPPPTATTPEGLLCVGGRLTPDWLLDAYRHGIFPWPMWENEPIVWWSPDPRAIFELNAFHISRRLARTLRSGRFTATSDRDFGGVIRGCATAAGRSGNTWLTPAMIEAYCRMHALGHAHSLEVWANLPLPPGRGSAVAGEGRGQGETQGGPHPNPLPKGEGIRLVGGTYGIAIGGLFAAESMFYRVRDASKVALAHLVAHLGARGYQLFDIQQWTPHTGSLGAIEISRDEYLRRLARVIDLPVTFGDVLCGQSW